MDLSIILSILCAMAWGVQAIFIKMAIKDITLYATILISLIINFLVIVVFIGIGSENGFSEFFVIARSTYIYFMIAGFLNYFLGRSFFYSSFRFIGVTQATSISSTYPILSVGFAIIGLGERLETHQFIGIALTLFGVYLLILKGGK